MKPIPKWLMIPPAVALLLILGPMSMQGAGLSEPDRATLEANAKNSAALALQADAADPTTSAAADATDAATPGRTTNAAPTVPLTPGFWKIGSALIGVLLLGVLGIYGLRRLRGGAVPTRGAKLVTLRQSLRLTPKQALHAIEFNDRILLIGESERGLALVESSNAPNQASDEAAVAAQAAAILDAVIDDDGAVPKNLLIPRPTRPNTALPTQPVMPKTTRSPGLGDFRSLLQKAGRS